MWGKLVQQLGLKRRKYSQLKIKVIQYQFPNFRYFRNPFGPSTVGITVVLNKSLIKISKHWNNNGV